MKLLSPDHSVLMEVSRLEREGSNLIIIGSIMGAMPIRAVLTPTETRSGLGLMSFRLKLFIFTLLFRS